MRLTDDELAAAPVHEGNLSLERNADGSVSAYLHQGDNPALGQLLIPLNRAVVTRLRGDEMIVVGYQAPERFRSQPESVQAWWCRLGATSGEQR